MNPTVADCWVLPIQIENAVQRGRAYVGAFYFDIGRCNTSRSRRQAIHPVNHTPEIPSGRWFSAGVICTERIRLIIRVAGHTVVSRKLLPVPAEA